MNYISKKASQFMGYQQDAPGAKAGMGGDVEPQEERHRNRRREMDAREAHWAEANREGHPGAGSAVGYSVALGHEQKTMQCLQAENFDLKLQISAMMKTLSPEQKRRCTQDGFYDFVDEDNGLDSPMKVDDGEVRALRLEVDELKKDLDRARDSAIAADDACKAARRDAAAARRACDEAREEAVVEQNEKETLREELSSELFTMQSEREEAVESEKRAASTMIVGLTLHRDSLQDSLSAVATQLKETRQELFGARAGRNSAQKTAETFEKKLRELEAATSHFDAEKSEANLADERAKLTKLQARLEAMEDQSDMRMKSALSSLTLNTLNGDKDGLSPNAFELYQSLVKRVGCKDNDASDVTRDPKTTHKWRQVVLHEMNDTLRALYSRTNELEKKRVGFIENYCQPAQATPVPTESAPSPTTSKVPSRTASMPLLRAEQSVKRTANLVAE